MYVECETQRIRVAFGFAGLADAELLSRGQSVLNGITGNPAYPNPPVEPAALKAALESYALAIGDAVDGGKKAKVERDRQRDAVTAMLRRLGHYVESACDGDTATLLSSGFDQMTITRAAPQPLEPARIGKVDYGNTGQLLIKVYPVPKAWSYELRYASLGPSGTPGSWTSQPVTAVRSSTPCNGLTPGVTYAFQIRALGRLGFTDWSDSVTKMCA